MKNIWFLRTDKDDCNNLDISESNPFIYSVHGICGGINIKKIKEYKNNVFPRLLVSGYELRQFIREIKQDLISSKIISESDIGKKQCDLSICYWIAVMDTNDIVFVRNKNQEVFICQVSGYDSERIFDENGFFQRPVNILKKVSEHDLEKQKLITIWHRTLGRRTLEINKKDDVRKFVLNYLNQT